MSDFEKPHSGQISYHSFFFFFVEPKLKLSLIFHQQGAVDQARETLIMLDEGPCCLLLQFFLYKIPTRQFQISFSGPFI